MTKVPNVKLSDGNEMPIIGLGTYEIKPVEELNAIMVAIDVGYRHFDCAFTYKNEKEVGQAIKEKIADGTVKRKDIFVTSKLWSTYHRRSKVLECCTLSLKALGLDYLDLYLVHWPVSYKEGCGIDPIHPVDENGQVLIEKVELEEIWKGMEDCHEKGLVKSIGLSNFNSEQIKSILSTCKIKPTVLQIECHPYLNQNKLIEFCTSHGISVTAYSPLGAPYRSWAKSDEPVLLDDPRIKKIADKHKKSPAQVLLRFNVQRGLSVIPKSATVERIRSNFEIFDFELTDEEMGLISNFKEKCRYCHMNWLKHVPKFPFNIEY